MPTRRHAPATMSAVGIRPRRRGPRPLDAATARRGRLALARLEWASAGHVVERRPLDAPAVKALDGLQLADRRRRGRLDAGQVSDGRAVALAIRRRGHGRPPFVGFTTGPPWPLADGAAWPWPPRVSVASTYSADLRAAMPSTAAGSCR